MNEQELEHNDIELKLERSLTQIFAEIAAFAEGMSVGEVVRAIRMIKNEGGFTPEEEKFILEQIDQGHNAKEISRNLLLYGISNRTSFLLKIHLLKLGIIDLSEGEEKEVYDERKRDG